MTTPYNQDDASFVEQYYLISHALLTFSQPPFLCSILLAGNTKYPPSLYHVVG